MNFGILRCESSASRFVKADKMKPKWTKIVSRLLPILSILGIATLAAGCVARRVVYVPVYQTAPGYTTQTVYAAPPASTNSLASVTTPANTQPGTVIVTQAPPPPQVEVIPVYPGPDYYWLPGYWYWGGPGWTWYRGRWAVRPWHGAAWVQGNWGRSGSRWAWHGGRWR